MTDGRATAVKRVLVTQSYFLRFDPKLADAGQPVPPLGSLICASVLRARGFEVSFFDAMLARSEDECGAALDRARADALVIFEDNFNYLTKMCLQRMRQAAVRMIELARVRGVEVIVAGSDATDDPAFFLRAGASAVATGEGEFSVAEWLWSSNPTIANIPGIATLRTDGHVTSPVPRPAVRDLDSIPAPAWDLVDVDAYRTIWMARHERFTLPLATSRGCPFHCNWCAKPIWGQRYNTVSPARAAQEVATLKQLGATHVNVVDDIFGLKPGWIEAFGAELERARCVLPFKCLSRADLLTESAIAHLKRAGCSTVWIGAESGSQRVLDAMEKGVTVAAIEGAVRRLHSADIKVGLFLQFGYPGETEDDVRATVAMVENTLPDDIGISVSYPLPGTRFHERVKAEMSAQTHWKDSSDLAMLFDGRQGTAYYRRLHAYVHSRFRLARALRRREGGLLRRAAQVSRHGAMALANRAALLVLARRRAPMRDLAGQMPREQAATPAPSAH